LDQFSINGKNILPAMNIEEASQIKVILYKSFYELFIWFIKENCLLFMDNGPELVGQDENPKSWIT
jgi:hypothetical protein